ncbi:hypothetical protein [Bacillus coahuilensis]|nr:hypothetical protein [Bacillus coahuilensis]
MIRSNSKNKTEKAKVAVQVEISKENVLQGIIFSEILGPPKSKKLLNRR